MDSLSDENRTLSRHCSTLTSALNDANKQLNDLRVINHHQKRIVEEHKTVTEELKAAVVALESEVTALTSKLQVVDLERSTASTTIASRNSRVKELEAELNASREIERQLKGHVEALESSCSALQHSVSQYAENETGYCRQIAESSEAVATAQEVIAGHVARDQAQKGELERLRERLKRLLGAQTENHAKEMSVLVARHSAELARATAAAQAAADEAVHTKARADQATWEKEELTRLLQPSAPASADVLADCARRLQALEGTLVEARQGRAAAEAAAERHARALEEATDKIARIKEMSDAELSRLTNTLHARSLELNCTKDALSSAEGTIAALRLELESCASGFTSALAAQQREAARTLLSARQEAAAAARALKHKAADMANERAIAAADTTALTKSCDALRHELDSLRSSTNDERQHLLDKLRTLQSRVDESKSEGATLREALAGAESREQHSQKSIRMLHVELAGAADRISALAEKNAELRATVEERTVETAQLRGWAEQMSAESVYLKNQLYESRSVALATVAAVPLSVSSASHGDALARICGL